MNNSLNQKLVSIVNSSTPDIFPIKVRKVKRGRESSRIVNRVSTFGREFPCRDGGPKDGVRIRINRDTDLSNFFNHKGGNNSVRRLIFQERESGSIRLLTKESGGPR